MKAGVLDFDPPAPKNVEEIHAAFDQSVREVEEYLKGMTEQTAQGNWRLMLREKELFSKPRIGVLRSIMLNHWYHHRGQLSVYLRLPDILVPVIYGRSADENPFCLKARTIESCRGLSPALPVCLAVVRLSNVDAPYRGFR